MIQFHFDPHAPVIVVDSELKHRNTRIHVNLVFDTGATYTMLSWASADALGLEPVRTEEKVPLNTASGHIEAPLVTLDNINVKGASVCDVEVVVHDLPEEARVDGLLGLNFLKKFQVNIDFRKGIISLFSPIKP